LGRIEAEAWTELERDLGADFAMVAAPALRDIVKQDGDVENAARGDLLDDRGGDRMVLLELASVARREEADRPDRVLVDGIMVVHVELHLRDDAAEVGHEAAEHARFVHPAKHMFGMVQRSQYLH